MRTLLVPRFSYLGLRDAVLVGVGDHARPSMPVERPDDRRVLAYVSEGSGLEKTVG